MLPMDDDIARKQIEEINAKVLSNRKPTFCINGGLYDAMKDAGGDVLVATNEEAKIAGDLFERTEGNDVDPAAAIALATLINAVEDGTVEKDAVIMLNITGGGMERFKRENDIQYLKPEMVFPINPDPEMVKEELMKL
jgi:cysteate synthase